MGLREIVDGILSISGWQAAVVGVAMLGIGAYWANQQATGQKAAFCERYGHLQSVPEGSFEEAAREYLRETYRVEVDLSEDYGVTLYNDFVRRVNECS